MREWRGPLRGAAASNPKIEMLWNSTVTALHGTEKLVGATVRNVNTGEESMLPVTDRGWGSGSA